MFLKLTEHVSEQTPGAMTLTPVQSHLKEQLVQKHRQLQEMILRQQEELRLISEQLNMGSPQPAAPSLPPAGLL